MGVDTECPGTTTEAVRDAQDAHLGHAQLATGGRKQRRDHRLRDIVEIGPQREVRRRADGKNEVKPCGQRTVTKKIEYQYFLLEIDEKPSDHVGHSR